MKTLVAVPCLDMVHTDFAFALACMHHGEGVSFAKSKSSLIYDSRNGLTNLAIEHGFDRVLFIDSDMNFDNDLFYKLSEDMDQGLDMVCGIYTTRKPPIEPAIYDDVGYDLNDEQGKATPRKRPFYNYPKDSLFEIQACGFGAVMVNTSVLEEVKRKFGLPFSPVLGFGEDLSFCLRAKELGKKMFCDSRIKLGHIGYREYTEADLYG